MALFDKFFNMLMRLEGGFVNNPSDHGGATKYGITQSLLDAVQYVDTEEVKDLTLPQAKTIYLREFYNPIVKILDVESLTAKQEYAYFDLAVNSGIRAAGKAYDSGQEIFAYRTALYQKIVAANPSQKVFLRGWLNRLTRIQNEFDEVSDV